jgi:hypothetical protein|tara:strand:+ start:101 stop:388 length:288 start_codon:yes stop_codon:yes gene_type:complete
MEKMNKLKVLCLLMLAVGIGCLGYSNYKLNKTVKELESFVEYNAMLSGDNSMRIEMFLQAMSNEFEYEVQSVVRPMIKKEVDSIKEVLKDIKKNE